MVKRKSTAKKARTRTVYRTAPRRRTVHKTGYDKIAPAMATVALVAVNKDTIKGTVNALTNNGRELASVPTRAVAGFTGSNSWVQGQYKKFITADALVKDAVAIAGGYVAGEAFKKFAPAFIKKPVAKISKKIPKVI